MKRLLHRYPISITIAMAIVYLSCFRPPKTSLSSIPNFDKIVHFSMYFCFSFLLCLEFIRAHRSRSSLMSWQGWKLGFGIPILFGSIMEIVQKVFTTYRSFEWGDIIADSIGVTTVGILVIIYIYKSYYKK